MIEDAVANVIGEIFATIFRQATYDAAADKLSQKKEPEPVPTYASKCERVKRRRQWRRLFDWA